MTSETTINAAVSKQYVGGDTPSMLNQLRISTNIINHIYSSSRPTYAPKSCTLAPKDVRSLGRSNKCQKKVDRLCIYRVLGMEEKTGLGLVRYSSLLRLFRGAENGLDKNVRVLSQFRDCYTHPCRQFLNNGFVLLRLFLL